MSIHIKTSIVIYEPNLDVLKKAVICLENAALFLKNHWQGEVSCSLDIVDNDSKIITLKEAQQFILKAIPKSVLKIKFLPQKNNLGYGKGHNVSIFFEKSDYHLVLNPDVYVSEQSLFQSLSYMEKSLSVGLMSPSVFGEGGEQHYLCKNNPTLFIMFLRSFAPMWFRRLFKKTLFDFEMRGKDYNKEIFDVPYLTGCIMFFRTKDLKKINGFDPRYFMYIEDADITREMLSVARTVYVPSIKVTHIWERGSHKNLKLMFVSIVSSLKYSWKWLWR